MTNIVSINKDSKQRSSDNFLGAYIDAQNNQRIPEEVIFVAGVILTLGLPEFFLSIYGGLIPLIVFASSLLVGSGLGVAINYYKLPYQTLSLNEEAESQVPASKNDTKKKAA
jgi:hypothetical protein